MIVATRFPHEVNEWIAAGVFDIGDAEAVRDLLIRSGSSDAPVVMWLLCGLTLRAYRDGHSRLNLDAQSLETWRPHSTIAWIEAADVSAVVAAVPGLIGHENTGRTVPRTPFIVDDDGLYIARVLHEETMVARTLLDDDGSRVDIILGGPGTGKTFTIAERLRAHPSPVPSIALCAPTGKAARHLKAVLDKRLRENGASDEVLVAVERAPSETAHRLLGYNPNGVSRYRHDADNPLDHDLVIVDEASMMSLSLMHNLLVALPRHGRIWLVGDPDQLASVDAGSVLADIKEAALRDGSILRARTEVLTDQHRFGPDSGIAALATAVRDRSLADVKSILQAGHGDLEWIDPVSNPTALARLSAHVVDHARTVLTAARAGDVRGALLAKSDLQVLSAVRHGQLGVDGWNAFVERGLGPMTASRLYSGRPVMVTRNDTATGLSNGDVGVVCRVDGEDRAFFGDPDDPITVSIARLPETVTVHALTIHKSQGSEYDHVVVVIPPGESRILTRELLYTGITRPRRRLTLVATWDSIVSAVGRDARRATGLAARL